MSALSLICDYGDLSSEESESEREINRSKKPKLPPPDLSKVVTVPTEEHIDNPALHSGRLRSFPHVRGNWATFVYVKYPNEDIVSRWISKLMNVVLTIDNSCQICDHTHLSLSRTVVLQYHLINTFTKSLQGAFSDIESFELQFDCVEVYCNDEETRTFIALKTDYHTKKYLLNVSKKIDEVLREFKLPPFYKEPAFHSSILWVNGNKKSIFEENLEQLNDTLSNEIKKDSKAVLIDRIYCKIGNKHYQYCLK